MLLAQGVRTPFACHSSKLHTSPSALRVRKLTDWYGALDYGLLENETIIRGRYGHGIVERFLYRNN